MANPNNGALERWTHDLGILFWGMMFALLASGCVHTQPRNGFARGGAETLLPKLTSVATGPAAVLLTNGKGFRSEFTMTLEDASESPLKLSGRVFARGGKLRLEAAFDQSHNKSVPAGDFGVIWDAAANQGYVFSETLQGYAPINEAVRFTNLLTQVVAGQTERIEGHLVDKANVTVMGSDGQTLIIQLLRAQDLGDLPLRIRSLNRPHSFALALSKIQLVRPADDLFLPPDGFTKYESEAALINELAARQQSVFGGGHEHAGAVGDYDEPGNRHRFKGNPSQEP
jgi:hypothetical protein